MSIRFLPAAQAELDEAIDWYAQQAVGLGDSFFIEFLKTLQLIERHPLGWHPLSENTRRCRMRHFPYGVIYSPDQEASSSLPLRTFTAAPVIGYHEPTKSCPTPLCMRLWTTAWISSAA